MAWKCSGRSNEELIDNLLKEGLIQAPLVAEAMRKVDRRNYVPDVQLAYQDSPQIIGYGATISAPHMHALACENLLPLLQLADKEAGAILDVGCGSGYLTAVLHHLAPSATVVGIDHIPGLTQMSRMNLAKDGLAVDSDDARIRIVTGDGRRGPYQVIHIGAAAPEIPQDLVDQLAKPGRMSIPVGTDRQGKADYTDIWQVDKSAEGEVTRTKLFGVRYVPLTDADSQWQE
ncbi:protein-L-isoaspartate O-methyltransferase [Dioszegia hungarica]|uniref:protein-L-isoaspartate(D-aspartate) O-methyltransferase n=1 Tax=Dioszegia hungarica TaxID=4972 RepID=A0AA38LVX2_9TREE|nr:protein-L-isoaspartate O-methyltransferase [Dioszegia hungarica]KAI9638322.1 protein-L-isoaspartate O-methyltransferase [Dioszegia hungarica]